MFRYSIIILFGLFLSRFSFAFESFEHKQLGDLAYHIALNIHCSHVTDPKLCIDGRPDINKVDIFYDPFEDYGSPKPGLSHLTYGDVVACVDYFLSTEKLIAGREANLITTPDAKTQAEEGPGPWSGGALFPRSRKDFNLNEGTRCNPSLRNREGARAAHVNHSHFQIELLLAQRTNHILALNLRTSNDNIFSALTLNAISDHYLQDSFAPGHVTTWRSRLTDLAANGYHDRINRQGIEVTISNESIEMLNYNANAREFQKHEATDTKSLFDLVFGELGLDGNKNEDASLMQVRARTTELFFGCPKEIIENCSHPKRDRAERIRALKGSLHTPPIYVTFHGDGDLWKEEQDLQRFIVLVTDVRSVLDVLQSQRIDDNQILLVDSFKNNKWTWQYVGAANNNPWDRLFRIQPSEMMVQSGPVIYNVGRRGINEPDRGSLLGADKSRFTSIEYHAMDRIFGVSAGVDTMTFGDAQNRRILGLETLIVGRPIPHRWGNWGVLGGLQPYSGPGKDGLAGTLRGVIIFPETEFAISVQGRLLQLRSRVLGTAWRPTWGFRMDAGFSSFSTFYLQVGRDAAVQNDGGIRKGYSVGAGFQVAAPVCHIYVIRNLSGC